tara:strand:+ start:147 stop:1139 length:993 start_codon:yes stop_codon:yes gene_type:complete
MSTHTHGPEQFVPSPYNLPREAVAYGTALEDLGVARGAKDTDAFLTARETIIRLAASICTSCRSIATKSQANPTTAIGACRAEWLRLKQEIFHTCGKCGTQRAVEANHGETFSVNAKLHKSMVKTDGQVAADKCYPAERRKLGDVSATTFWPNHGGVAALRAEADKCAPLCRMCHTLDPSSTAAPENVGSRAKAEAKEYETKAQRQNAIYNAGHKEDKRNYNNAIKRKIGACENSKCVCDGPSNGRCVEGFEMCYDWDHLVESTKRFNIAHVVHKTSSLAVAKPEILAELGLPSDFDVETDELPPVAQRRCRLLCKNCHITRKDWDVSSS